MQTDFHHATTYCLARIAGFDHPSAEIVAYCAQYVDDAVTSGLVEFDNGAAYSRIATAHKNLDYSNFRSLEQARIWLPFHFMPGNAGLPAGQSPPGRFAVRLITRPDSHPARDMLRLAVEGHRRPWALHRLGISMHVYADTWAHQGFAGISHDVNNADDVRPDDETLSSWGQALVDRLQHFFVERTLPLGHALVLSCPDRPYLRWRYTNWAGETVVRDNTAIFLDAAEHMVRWMRRYRLADADADTAGMSDADGAVVEALLRNTQDPDELDRHRIWTQAAAEGRFSFGPATISYIGTGPGSWKALALNGAKGNEEDEDDVPFHPSFLTSNWKAFHDAAQAHRLSVLNDVLPRYGICAA